MSRGSRVRSPPGVACAISVMVIIDASQALDPGSIPGWRIGALAQSEECVLCKHEAGRSKLPFSTFCTYPSGFGYISSRLVCSLVRFQKVFKNTNSNKIIFIGKNKKMYSVGLMELIFR